MESSDLGKLARRVTVVPTKGADATPIVVYERKKKRRKGFRKTRGHRSIFTRVRITDIQL